MIKSIIVFTLIFVALKLQDASSKHVGKSHDYPQGIVPPKRKGRADNTIIFSIKILFIHLY